MKISPVAAGASAVSTNLDDGRSAGADRMARAKQVAQGIVPAEAPPEPQALPTMANQLRRIKMKTNATVDRNPRIQAIIDGAAAQVLPTESAQGTPINPEVAQVATNEPTKAASDATQPLSPQFAALAREKRALQLLKKEIEAKQQTQTNQPSGMTEEEIRAKLEANPLSFLLERGVTYDKLTEAVLSQTQETNPAIQRLEAEIQTLKKGLEDQTKTLSQRDQDAEQQVLAQMSKDAEQLISQGDDFEMVREAGYAPKAVELIHKVYKQTGEIMEVSEALSLVENELLEESLKFAKLKKVQQKLAPSPAPQATATPPAPTQGQPRTIRMRTLTNRDGTSVPSSPRERAIAAFYGQLKR